MAFDAAYYRRFYEDPRTRVSSAGEHAKLVAAVVAFVEYSGVELRAVLDVGAGVGRWGTWLRKHRRWVRVVSTEMDPAVCAKYGHERRDIAQWKPRAKFDLVICQGVLPYLSDADAARAIDNLAAAARGFLYLEAITARDLDEVCDASVTDTSVQRRTGAWYRERLGRHFQQVGAGLWCKRDAPIAFYELEAAADAD